MTRVAKRKTPVAAITIPVLSGALLVSSCSVLPPSTTSPTTAEQSCEDIVPRHTVEFDPQRIARLKEIVREFVDAGIAPGAVLKIERNGEIAIDFAYGVSDIENGKPMMGAALFRLYSMTKPVTSVAALRLVEQGQISLDDPVSRYIPEFSNTKVYSGAGDDSEQSLKRPITIRDLLTHTAGMSYQTNSDAVGRIYAKRGIPAGPGVANPPTDGSAPVNTLEELAGRVATTPLSSQPGERWSYGNATDVLGRVLEVVTGKPLREVLEELVLVPTGMSDTAFQVAPEDVSRMTAAYINPAPKQSGKGVAAMADLETIARPQLTLADPADGGIFEQSPSIEYGGAGLIGTASDYLRFTRMLRSNGVAEGTRILEAATVDELSSSQISDLARTNATTLGGLGFGFGFATNDRISDPVPNIPICGYFWGGAASTFFWVDPVGDVSGVLMTQVFGGDTSSLWLALMEEIYGEAS